MKKIILITNEINKKTVNSISAKLEDLGYAVQENFALKNDENSTSFYESLSDFDAFLFIASEESFENSGFVQLLKAIKAFSREKDIPLIIIDQYEIGEQAIISDLIIVNATHLSSEQTAIEINRILAAFSIQKSLILEHQNIKEKKELSSNIEISSESYINETIENLKKSENRQLHISFIFYAVSFLSLFIGGYFCFLLTMKIESNFFTKINEAAVIYYSLKSIVILSIFIASSKLSFNLAKEYRRVAIKNSDRLHAIRFGEFYLNSFKNNVEWKEVKEVFQHWNIDNELLTRINNEKTSSTISGSFLKELYEALKGINTN